MVPLAKRDMPETVEHPGDLAPIPEVLEARQPLLQQRRRPSFVTLPQCGHPQPAVATGDARQVAERLFDPQTFLVQCAEPGIVPLTKGQPSLIEERGPDRQLVVEGPSQCQAIVQ